VSARTDRQIARAHALFDGVFLGLLAGQRGIGAPKPFQDIWQIACDLVKLRDLSKELGRRREAGCSFQQSAESEKRTVNLERRIEALSRTLENSLAGLTIDLTDSLNNPVTIVAKISPDLSRTLNHFD
jgi:hypothetical protein